MQKNLLLLFILLTISFQSSIAQEITYTLVENISYIPESETSEYANERCKLDLYFPENQNDFVTVVWFHGGGLTGGEKSIPETLKGKGIAVVAVNYRLSPKVKSPVYIEDAASRPLPGLSTILKNTVAVKRRSLFRGTRPEVTSPR